MSSTHFEVELKQAEIEALERIADGIDDLVESAKRLSNAAEAIAGHLIPSERTFTESPKIPGLWPEYDR